MPKMLFLNWICMFWLLFLMHFVWSFFPKSSKLLSNKEDIKIKITEETKPVIQTLKRLRLSDEQICKLQVSYPSFFSGKRSMKVEEDLERIVEVKQYLDNYFGINGEKYGNLISRYPSLLYLGVSHVGTTMKFLEDDLGFGHEATKKIITKVPSLLGFTNSRLGNQFDLWKQKFNLTDTELQTMVILFPSLLAYSENHIDKLVEYLRSEIGFDDDLIRRLILQFPQIFGYNVEYNMKSVSDYLSDELELDNLELQKIIDIYPAVLSLSLEKNIKARVEYFQDTLGMSLDEIKKVFISQPRTLGMSLDNNLRPSLQYLADTLGITHHEWGKIIWRRPSILIMSATKLKAKVDFFQHSFGIRAESLKEKIFAYPQILSYSLEKRLIPRYILMVDRLNIDKRFILPHLHSQFSTYNDKKFIDWLVSFQREPLTREENIDAIQNLHILLIEIKKDPVCHPKSEKEQHVQ